MSNAGNRLSSITGHIAPSKSNYIEKTSATRKKWDNLPSFDELPKFHNFAGCAWGVWGEGDQLGTVNLLTEDVVKEAAKEIKTGQTICLNWPINFPEKPMFSRKAPEAKIIQEAPITVYRDDELYINTQSGSQWDGVKHFGIVTKDNVFYYQNTPSDSFQPGHVPIPDPLNIDYGRVKYGIHNWSQHGIVGRGVFLDLVRYFTRNGDPLPYDPWTTHGITVDELKACAEHEGVKFKQGDILILRVGFIRRYYESSQKEKDRIGSSPEEFAGIEQGEEMKRFLWNNHFAAIASDQPALERWPPEEGTHLHQTILGLWGMPIGEMFDLEKLSEVCVQTGRYTFFFTSWPLNILGGCASPPNAAAYL